jgi:hypothetical protein
LSAPSKTGRGPETIRARHDRLRRLGLRPVRIWVPDPNAATFAAEAHRQSVAVATSDHAKEDQDFIDAASWWNEA